MEIEGCIILSDEPVLCNTHASTRCYMVHIYIDKFIKILDGFTKQAFRSPAACRSPSVAELASFRFNETPCLKKQQQQDQLRKRPVVDLWPPPAHVQGWG